jgi:Putative restriction endonuclease
MSTQTTTEVEAIKPDGYPFHIGTRPVLHRDSAGTVVGHHYEPLTEWDYLHPQEEDRFMSADLHSTTLHYLRQALTIGLRHRPELKTYTELRIDWQRSDMEPHGPDAIVFEGMRPGFDRAEGTLPVEDFGAKVVAVFEVTSPATRHIDFGDKFDEFIVLGIPYFVVVDAAAPNKKPAILAFKLMKSGYRMMLDTPKLGLRIPPLDLWLRWESDRLIVADHLGKDIPDELELVEAYDEQKARADALALELAQLKARLNDTK